MKTETIKDIKIQIAELIGRVDASQFMEFTGQSNRAVSTAIQKCVEVGWIIAKDKNGTLCNTPDKRRRRRVWYRLGSVFTSKISSEESSLDEKNDKNLVNNFPKSSEQNDINLVKKVHNTKETITKETLQKGVVGKKPYFNGFPLYEVGGVWKVRRGHNDFAEFSNDPVDWKEVVYK